jgi:tagaturonate epimerase
VSENLSTLSQREDVAQVLGQLAGLQVYPRSVSLAGEGILFLGRGADGRRLGILQPTHDARAFQLAWQPITWDGTPFWLGLGVPDHANALALRARLPFTAPRSLGIRKSAGLGDRLGIATPGHIRALRQVSGIAPILAQQSVREMQRAGRTPADVLDDATWGVFQEGFRRGFGADADHLQKIQDLDVTVKAGFTMFTVDPGQHVVDAADDMDAASLAAKYESIDFETLALKPAELKRRYAGKTFTLAGGMQITLDETAFLRAAVKYGNAVAHVVKMYRHLKEICRRPFELEVSVDETASPTSTAEHYFFSAELKRLGVRWVSMAPRFVGRFEKGVDYIGDLDIFRKSFAEHVAVMRTLGPYKISIHSGSDKFSIYPIVAELTEGLVHLKTAGTSYLEALRAMTRIDPALFREILDFARGRYETDKATYHVSADVKKVPASKALKDDQLAALLDDFDAREVLHVTFGSVLTADGGEKFRNRLMAALNREEEKHYSALQKHLERHISPLDR